LFSINQKKKQSATGFHVQLNTHDTPKNKIKSAKQNQADPGQKLAKVFIFYI